MTLVQNHLGKYFEDDEPQVLHPMQDIMGYHIDCLVYRPNERYPFWKLVTMGASDFKMPKSNAIADRNEYIMFIDKNEDLYNQDILNWYYGHILDIATYPIQCNKVLTYGHDITWETDEEMCGAYIELPQIIPDSSIVKLKLGLMKEIAFLQIMLLNKMEFALMQDIGNEQFSYYLYPTDRKNQHFLCQRSRNIQYK